MNKSIVSIGIDLSLTGTGVVMIKNGKIVLEKLIKSKPSGDLPVHELERIQRIVNEILNCTKSTTIDIAVIENLAFGVRNATSLTQLAGLNYFTRAMLHAQGIPFVLVAPTTLKKFITGNGAAKKDVILMEVFKKYNVAFVDDNLADAFSLSKIGEAVLDGDIRVSQAERDVIKLIKKQYEPKQKKK